jgi:EmrB/QacA subfamily drug resistance transporter
LNPSTLNPSASSPLTPSEVRVIVIGALLALFLSALDQTIVATALPPIAKSLGDFSLISWVVTSYLLTSACVTPIAGKLSDLYGRRRILRVCLATFMVTSALCALAPTMPVLIVARALQGLGGGGLVTLGQTIIADVVSPRERGRYSGYFSIVWGSASLLGPLVGGIVTQYYGWPWIFWLNLPFSLAALLFCDRALRRLPIEHRRSPVDYWSIGLLSGATIGLLLVLSLGGARLPWMSPMLLLLALATICLGGLLVWKQRDSEEPIIPPRFLSDPVVGPVLTVTFIIYAAFMAISVLAPIYLQVALGTSVAQAGALMIPLMLSSTVSANFMGRYTRRRGRYKLPPLVSLPATVLALVLLAVFASRLSPPVASGVMLIAGLGFGPIFPACNVAAQNAVERRDLGAVSGAVAFARVLGSAVGVAAASALVLGLLAGRLVEAGHVTQLEDLARESLAPAARTAVADVFGIMFAAVAVVLVAGVAIFAKVEDRELGDRVPVVAHGGE